MRKLIEEIEQRVEGHFSKPGRNKVAVPVHTPIGRMTILFTYDEWLIQPNQAARHELINVRLNTAYEQLKRGPV